MSTDLLFHIFHRNERFQCSITLSHRQRKSCVEVFFVREENMRMMNNTRNSQYSQYSQLSHQYAPYDTRIKRNSKFTLERTSSIAIIYFFVVVVVFFFFFFVLSCFVGLLHRLFLLVSESEPPARTAVCARAVCVIKIPFLFFFYFVHSSFLIRLVFALYFSLFFFVFVLLYFI